MKDNIIKYQDYRLFLNSLPPNSVDFICTDPPYGKINGMQLQGQKSKTDWDINVNWKELFNLFNRLLKPGGTIAIFGQNPTYAKMIVANLNQYKYEYIWVKNNCAQGFNSNIMPLIYNENIAIFIKEGKRTFNKIKDIKTELIDEKYFNRYYVSKLLHYLNKTRTQIHKDLGHRRLEFYLYFTGINFNLCSEKLYKQLTDKYNLRKWNQYIEWDELKKKWIQEKKTPLKFDVNKYSNVLKNVLYYNKDHNTIHPTQKPYALIKFLVNNYSKQNDVVLDPFMGSEVCLRVCNELKRTFYGCDIKKWTN